MSSLRHRPHFAGHQVRHLASRASTPWVASARTISRSLRIPQRWLRAGDHERTHTRSFSIASASVTLRSWEMVATSFPWLPKDLQRA